jgi:replicative DNA helicase
MIFSIELEQHLLAGLIKYPKKYFDISSVVNPEDFYSEDSCVNKTIFIMLKQMIESGEVVDDIILSQRVKSLGISFEDNINPSEYIKALRLRQISPEGMMGVAEDIKKLSLRRSIQQSSLDVAKKMKSIPPNMDLNGIIEAADKIYNSDIDLLSMQKNSPENIYDSMEQFIEGRALSPITEFGLMGPHKRINEMYGSLLRPGNITVVVARSGVGKTQFCMDFCTKVSLEHDVPVLHFDNGEMSKEELIIRQCAALSGVSMHLLETGKWRDKDKETIKKVTSVWNKIKNLKFYYYNVAGMDVDSMINILKRFYFSKVGRGKKMIFSFDYIKTTSEKNSKNQSHWQLIGDMVTKFKNCIQREICEDGNPMIPMITSVQSNRQGITFNRSADSVVDDESIVSLSDQITQFSSHLFALRRKTMDELENEPNDFGTHKLICLKYRHLGENPLRAIDPVQLQDGTKRNNYINLKMENFCMTEKGDLVDMVEYQSLGDFSPDQDVDDLAPAL